MLIDHMCNLQTCKGLSYYSRVSTNSDGVTAHINSDSVQNNAKINNSDDAH